MVVAEPPGVHADDRRESHVAERHPLRADQVHDEHHEPRGESAEGRRARHASPSWPAMAAMDSRTAAPASGRIDDPVRDEEQPQIGEGDDDAGRRRTSRTRGPPSRPRTVRRSAPDTSAATTVIAGHPSDSPARAAQGLALWHALREEREQRSGDDADHAAGDRDERSHPRSRARAASAAARHRLERRVVTGPQPEVACRLVDEHADAVHRGDASPLGVGRAMA